MKNVRGMCSSSQLALALAEAFEREAGVPLLVLRVPEVARRAWREGKRAALRLERETIAAFSAAAARLVRDGDLLVHDAGSDWFAIALLAPARDGRALSLDARSALERIAAAMSLVTGSALETGWWPVRAREGESLERIIEQALERGVRERERFEFLAAIGHELRTPLTSIRGYLETVLEEELDEATARRFLHVANSEALRLARMVDDLLDFSLLDFSPRPGAGSTDLALALSSAIDALEPVARAAGVALQPPSASRAFAQIGQDACMHVLLNVIENAIKYGRRGGVVGVSLERQDPYVRIVIDDDGPGIAAGDRERIFDLGARLSRARPRGRGLGLAIVRTIVERAAGSVVASASPFGGARFVVTLPAAKAEIATVAS